MNERSFTYKLIEHMSKIFGFNKKTSSRFLNFLNYYGLHDMLGRVLESETKVYTSEIVIPTVGVITVTRDKDNNIVSSTIELANEYKKNIIKTMDGESLLTDMIDDMVIESIKRRYNNIM